VRCHAQLSLACELGVPIVPAMAEAGYAPGGWLGLLCGDRLYFTFRDRGAWESSAEAIAGELERCAQAAAIASAGAGRRRAMARPAGPVAAAQGHFLRGVRDAITRALCAVLSTRPPDPLRVMAAALNEAAAHPA